MEIGNDSVQEQKSKPKIAHNYGRNLNLNQNVFIVQYLESYHNRIIMRITKNTKIINNTKEYNLSLAL